MDVFWTVCRCEPLELPRMVVEDYLYVLILIIMYLDRCLHLHTPTCWPYQTRLLLLLIPSGYPVPGVPSVNLTSIPSGYPVHVI